MPKNFTIPFLAAREGLLLALAEGFGQGQGFLALRAKKELFTLFVIILGHFWCSVVTSVVFTSTLSNLVTKIQKSR